MSITDKLSDIATSPASGVSVGATVSVGNWFSGSLPFIINMATAVYVILLASQKAWDMYSAYKKSRKT